ncbi:MAG: HNH endonuclease [Mesorhizobium sp.]|nr:MAG: HNH endonuclease [Mesorhizobium sp.]
MPTMHDTSRRDSRSAEAAEYRKLYSTARWKRLREVKLAQQPLCEWCLEQEIVEPATEVHHADGGHKGDVVKFWTGPFVSTCKPCHSSRGQMEDHGKTVVTHGVDGYPIE